MQLVWSHSSLVENSSADVYLWGKIQGQHHVSSEKLPVVRLLSPNSVIRWIRLVLILILPLIMTFEIKLKVTHSVHWAVYEDYACWKPCQKTQNWRSRKGMDKSTRTHVHTNKQTNKHWQTNLKTASWTTSNGPLLLMVNHCVGTRPLLVSVYITMLWSLNYCKH